MKVRCRRAGEAELLDTHAYGNGGDDDDNDARTEQNIYQIYAATATEQQMVPAEVPRCVS